jgi:hypothetical protein
MSVSEALGQRRTARVPAGTLEYRELRHDPWQLNSVASDPDLRTRLRTLRRILGDLSRCKGAECGRIAAASVR